MHNIKYQPAGKTGYFITSTNYCSLNFNSYDLIEDFKKEYKIYYAVKTRLIVEFASLKYNHEFVTIYNKTRLKYQ